MNIHLNQNKETGKWHFKAYYTTININIDIVSFYIGLFLKKGMYLK